MLETLSLLKFVLITQIILTVIAAWCEYSLDLFRDTKLGFFRTYWRSIFCLVLFFIDLVMYSVVKGIQTIS